MSAARNPMPIDLSLSIESVDNYKRSDCRLYEQCMNQAAEENWPQFHCNACQAYVKIEDDHEALILGRKLLTIFGNEN